MMREIVQLTERETHWLVTMDDGKVNAIGFAMLEQLNSALNVVECSGKPMVLTGRQGKFSAGFDLDVMRKVDSDTQRLLRQGADLTIRLLDFPLPVVAAVSGHALAMGALLCLSVDYRIGTQGPFKLGLNEVAIGMTLPWFGVELARGRLAPEWLPRAVDLALLLDPDTSVKAGYLDRVVAPEALITESEALAVDFSALDMVAHCATKKRTRESMLQALTAGLQRDFKQA